MFPENLIKDFLLSHEDAMRLEQEVIARLLEQDPSAFYLDLGCHDGRNMNLRSDVIGTDLVYGLDCIKGRIIKTRDSGRSALEGELNQALPFPDATFDVITATEVIEHLTHPDSLLAEVKRVLKPVSGYAVLTTNNLAALHYRLELLFGKQPRCMAPSLLSHEAMGRAEDCGHRSVFTYEHLKKVIELYGFKIDTSGSHTLYPLPVFLSEFVTSKMTKLGTYSYFKIRA